MEEEILTELEQPIESTTETTTVEMTEDTSAQLLLEVQSLRHEYVQLTLFQIILLMFFIFRWGWLNWKR